MKNKDKEIIEKFRDEYKKAYKGILSDEALNEGNEWFENYLLQVRREAIEECIKEATDTDIREDNGNTYMSDEAELMRDEIIENLIQLKNE